MGYVWSPLAPSPSGVAQYARTLIGGDPLFDDLTFVTEVADERRGQNAIAPSGDVWNSGRALLQLGNNIHHGFVLERARQGGAILELHDLSLHRLHAGMTLEHKDFPGYLAALQDAEGEWGRRAAFQRAKGIYTPRLEVYMRVNRALCERARAIIVHSRWAHFQLEIQWIETPIHVIPRYAPNIDQSHAKSRTKAAARERLGLDPDRFVLLVAGPETPDDRFGWVLDAFEQMRDGGAAIELVIAGVCACEVDEDRIAGSAHAHAIRTTGVLDAEGLDEHVLAADILPLLQFPSAGGSSALGARALGLGRVIAAPEYAAFSDLPDAVCEKIHLDRPVAPQLVAAISRYHRAPERLRAMEARVGDYAARHLSLGRARASLRAVLDRYWH